MEENKSLNTDYFYFIDLLRILAILGSFLHHSNVIYFLYGHSFFFFLSGFLLTNRFKQEIETKNQFNFWSFTFRRIIKIVPLYYLIVLFTYYILPFLTDIDYKTIPISNYLFFVSNYSNEKHIFILMILWSISVQEQFYIFISLIFKFFSKYIVKIAILMILISLIYKIYFFNLNVTIYAHTLNHFSTYGIGIIYAMYYKKINLYLIKKISVILFICSIFCLYFFSFYLRNNISWILFDNIIVSFFFIFIFNHLLKSKSSILKNKVVHYFGNLYYGMYCYQGIIITFTNFVILKYIHLNLYEIAGLNFIILLVVAFLSFNLFENPILKLKKKLRPNPKKNDN